MLNVDDLLKEFGLTKEIHEDGRCVVTKYDLKHNKRWVLKYIRALQHCNEVNQDLIEAQNNLISRLEEKINLTENSIVKENV